MIIKTKMLFMIFIAATLVCSDISHCAETGTAVPSRTIQGGQLPQGVSRQMIQNYQQGGGQATTPSSIQNLPPGTSQNLPPSVIQQLPSAVQKQISDAQSSGTADPNMDNGNLNDFSDINSLELISDTKESLTGEKGDGVDEISSETDSAGDNEEKNENTSVSHAGNIAFSISIIEKQYRSAYSSPLASGLRQFGYDIFSSARVQPSGLAVPDENYLLGTGDNLLIRVWGGTVDAVYPAVVDREGIVNIPKIGPISVVGVKYGALESVIRNEAEKYIQGINISITLTKLRSLEIYVVGEVSNPGLHMLPSFSTIFDGLIYGGGVKKSGTLRNIKLYRDGDEKHPFDLYDLILKGNRKSDHMLQNKDVIFVEKIGKTAAVAGAVNNQGIFEIIGKRSIKELANLAGGILPQAFGDKIYLKRFDKNREFVFQDINIAKNPQAWNKIMVNNGDLLELDFMGSTLPYVVRLEGHVWKPDLFHYKSGMALSDILTSTDLLMPDTLMEFALIYRYNSDTTRTSPMRFPLSRVFSGNYNAPLEPYDKIVILSRESFGIKEKITLNGAVWKPGEYRFVPGLKLKDALALAGGVNDEARIDKIEVRRPVKTNEKFETQYIKLHLEKDGEFELKTSDTVFIPRFRDYVVRLEGNVWNEKVFKYHNGVRLSDILISKDLPKPEDLLKPGSLMEFGLIYRYDPDTTRTTAVRFPLSQVFSGTYDASLQPFDKVVVLSRDTLGIEEKISVEGAVWNGGEFIFQPGLRLADAVALAGGVKFGARTDRVEVARQIIVENSVETLYVALDLEKDANFMLQSSDAILIPLIKGASRITKVVISGEIKYPGTYAIRENEKISELIGRAGGFTENAYLYGAKYTSEEARKIQQQSIDKMLEKLKLSSLVASSEMAQVEDVKAAEAAENSLQEMINTLQGVRAEGRIAIKLSDIDVLRGTNNDFALQDGATLNIPSRPSFVSVVGSVYSPGSFLYEPGRKLDFYLDKSGGSSLSADEEHLYILKANGEIISMGQTQGIFSKIYNTVLVPGDTIVVPEDMERVPYIKKIGNISDILFKIATTAGVALAL